MMKNPQVHIILLNWKTPEMTARCIHSVKLQTYDNFKIVVVDNASGDHSVSYLKNQFPDITVLESSKNKGFAGGCNMGIRFALKDGTDAVWLLNNDAEADPHALAELVQKAEVDKKLGLIGSSVFKMGDKKTPELLGGGYLRAFTARLQPRLSLHQQKPLDYAAGSSLYIKREVFDSIGLLDEDFFMYWEDVEFSQRARKAGYSLGHAENSVVYHEEHGTTEKTGKKTTEWFAKGTVLYYRKHHILWIIPIITSFSGRIMKALFTLNGEEIRLTFSGFWQGIKVPLNQIKSSKR